MPYNMELPKRKCCFDCFHFERCKSLFGCLHTNTVCDFSPSRFRECPAEQGESPGTASNTIKAAIELLKKAQADLIALDFDTGYSADLVTAIDNFVATAAVD